MAGRFPANRQFALSVGVAIALFISAILIAVSLQKVKSTEYGLQYDVHAKKLGDEAQESGLHLGPPGYKFIKFPSTYITTSIPEDMDNERDGTCVTRDGLRVNIHVTFQYQMTSDWVDEATVKYRTRKRWSNLVNAAAVSAVQLGCSLYDIPSFQNERGKIQQSMENALREKLEGVDGVGGVFARAVGLQLRNIELPREYTQAISDKQSAAEDVGLAINQRNQMMTQASTNLQAAEENAKRVMDTAQANAEILLSEAQLQADGIKVDFETEADVYRQVKESLNLTTEGLLSYLGSRLVEETGQLDLSLTEPAKASYRDEL